MKDESLRQFAADAPDFVPLAAMTEMPFQVHWRVSPTDVLVRM